MSRPITESGREAVRLRGLLGGETEERASLWIRKIEEEAMEVQRDLRRMADLIEAERSAGAAPLDLEALRRAMYSLNMYGSAFALAEAYAEAEAARLSEGTDR